MVYEEDAVPTKVAPLSVEKLKGDVPPETETVISPSVAPKATNLRSVVIRSDCWCKVKNAWFC